MVDRVDPESLWFICPEFADVFVGREALEGFEATAKIVGVHEVGEMGFELLVTVVVVAFDSRVLDGPVHPFDLAIRPRVFDQIGRAHV